MSSGPVSRILSAPKDGATISLDAASLRRSSSQPGSTNGPGDPSPLFGLAPGGVCTAALLPGRRCALTAPFQPYPSEDRRYVSVALSVGSRRPGVTWHPCPVESGLSSTARSRSGRTARWTDPLSHGSKLEIPGRVWVGILSSTARSGSGRTGRDSGWTDLLSHGSQLEMPGGVWVGILSSTANRSGRTGRTPAGPDQPSVPPSHGRVESRLATRAEPTRRKPSTPPFPKRLRALALLVAPTRRSSVSRLPS